MLFALAVCAIASPDAARLIESSLAPTDLKSSGAELHRKLTVALQPIGHLYVYGPPIRRVQNTDDMLVVDWRRHGVFQEQPPILVFTKGDSVSAVAMPRMNGEPGWHSAAFRRTGDTVIGCGYSDAGTLFLPAAVALTRSGSGWKVQSTQGGDEISSIGFAKPHGTDLVVDFRDYGFKRLVAPHAGPLLTYRAIWRFREGKFRAEKPRLVRNALTAFDELVDGVYGNNQEAVRRIMPDSALRAYFRARLKELGGKTSVVSHRQGGSEKGTIFGIDLNTGRGDWRESIFVGFAWDGKAWRAVKVGRWYAFLRA